MESSSEGSISLYTTFDSPVNDDSFIDKVVYLNPAQFMGQNSKFKLS